MVYQIQGIPIIDLAERYGTPLYIYDGNEIKNAFLELKSNIPDYLEVFFSLKSNPNISVYNLLKSLGAKAEVSSLTELKTVLMANTNPNDIIFLGPGKSEEEIKNCIDHSIYAIVCESFQELELINEIASLRKKRVRVAIRVNPTFTVKGSRLSMGGKPRQFGIDEEEIFQNISILNSYKNVEIIGIQVYMGTRILDGDVICQNTQNILKLAEKFSKQTDQYLQFVDIGGGLGVPYFGNEEELNIQRLGKQLAPIIADFKANFPNTRLAMEAGRYLVAKSGIFVSKVNYTKKSREENFVITDGGTNCHMAAVGIGSFVKRNFPMINLTNLNETDIETYNVTGPLCTPNDIVGKNVELSRVQKGDLIGVLQSGAYGPSASPGLFLSHGFPAEVMILNGEHYLIRRRDHSDDIIDKQIMVNEKIIR
ncbi:diaminopimelate decarboxylase [Lysinibacillus sp. YS11]|uniref:diaminopimelate decarboxylase n=1 Tax=Lysinibacillus TaxID=400634 RepID=UPI00082615B0|nr:MULTISPECIES: diaminopimelate decarboxylase [Lysinibacillus]AUS84879.1 diaminopimelate decarboxylase [Lysinibacillus sp. YS11]MEC1304545.1 diaminopimelate decarboxylase [Lysinibacillus capsici]MED3876112.1 diaminopimelate decarboxylase [Lysinibacillus capsici]OCX60881.1 diaminopimelate decarboxylase [Lysinibacillus sp. AR18-8]WPK05535.1 diaminopimelate decarboxylase [Lysinibacillus capsici]